MGIIHIHLRILYFLECSLSCGEPSWKSTEDPYTISPSKQISGRGIYNNLHDDKMVLAETMVQPDVQPCTSTDSAKVTVIFSDLLRFNLQSNVR